MNKSYYKMTSRKILLIGAGGCGKTTFIQRLNGEKFEHRYIPTYNANMTTIRHMNQDVSIIDTAGQEIMSRHDELDCDAAMIMFDVGSVLSYKRAEKLYQKLQNKNIPIVFVGNKSETYHAVKKESLLNSVPYYEISTFKNINLMAPISHVLN